MSEAGQAARYQPYRESRDKPKADIKYLAVVFHLPSVPGQFDHQ